MKIGVPAATSKTQYYINKAYVQYVLEAGFQPVVIVPGSNDETMLDMVEGLLLPGGVDIDPIY